MAERDRQERRLLEELENNPALMIVARGRRLRAEHFRYGANGKKFADLKARFGNAGDGVPLPRIEVGRVQAMADAIMGVRIERQANDHAPDRQADPHQEWRRAPGDGAPAAKHDTTPSGGEPAARRGAGGRLPPGGRRLEWLYIVTANPNYTRLALSIAGALAWKYSDSITAETFVGVDKLMTHVRAGKRAVQEHLSTFLADGFLTKVKSRAQGRPVTYRLTFPGELPVETKNPTKTDKPMEAPKSNKPATPKNWTELVTHIRVWLNAEPDNTAVETRWKSKSETMLRAACCDGVGDGLKECERMLEHRLKHGKCYDELEDEIPF